MLSAIYAFTASEAGLNEKIAKIADDYVDGIDEDYVLLLQPAYAVQRAFGPVSNAEVKRLTLKVVRLMLDRGLRPGDYLWTGFRFWDESDPGPILARIDREWDPAAGIPTLDKPICWFDLPGRRAARTSSQRTAKLVSEGKPGLATLASSHMPIRIFDPGSGAIPLPKGGSLIAVTESCIEIRNPSDSDGDIEFMLGETHEVDPGDHPTFQGKLKTPDRRVALWSVFGESILEASVPRLETTVRIWVNNLHAPSRVIVGIE